MRIPLVSLAACARLCCPEDIFTSRVKRGKAARFDFGCMFSPSFFRCRAQCSRDFGDTADPFRDGLPAKSGAPSHILKNSVMTLEDVSRILHASRGKEVTLPTDEKSPL